MIEKFINVVSCMLIIGAALLVGALINTAVAGGPPAETMSSGLITADDSADTSGNGTNVTGRLWSVHGRATDAAAICKVYDGDRGDTGTAAKCLVEIAQATSGGLMQATLNGIRYWKGLYLDLTNCEVTLELDMK